MNNLKILREKLKSIDGLDYGRYQSLIGEYSYPDFKLIIEQIPKDPFAPPHTGIYCLHIGFDKMNIPSGLNTSKLKRTAVCDFLARAFFNASEGISPGRRGTGNSGVITVAEPGQIILERSSVILKDGFIEIRFFMGLPAVGRIIKREIAENMFFDELPEIVKKAFFKGHLNESLLLNHIETSEDAQYLRAQLDQNNLIAFISNGAILPRESGTSDKPLNNDDVIPFQSPVNLEVEVNLPNAGKIKGMGIKKGVTLLVGGGFHGKSTLLKAVESGIYNHIPDDGREKCVTHSSAVKIRSYSGRYVEKVDISTFIKNLPLNKQTKAFSTENASGSTSQAASIQEAVEMDVKVLLMDEDTSATNFMIRDWKMQKLVLKNDEPITPFIDKIKQFYQDKNISTVLVLGGIGDYFEVSDTIIQMIRYLPEDVTTAACLISQNSTSKRLEEDDGYSINPENRIPVKNSVDPNNAYKKVSVYAKEPDKLNFGKTVIDLVDLEQLVELSQTKAIGQALIYLRKYIDGKTFLKDIVINVMKDIEKNGLDIISNKKSGHFALFRDFELAASLNRLREFKVEQKFVEKS